MFNTELLADVMLLLMFVAVVLATLVGPLLLALLTFLLGSSAPMHVNGQLFDNGFWLRAADMFIVTSGVMLLAGGIVYAYSELRNKK